MSQKIQLKSFFYFKSKNSARYFNVTDKLNSSLPKFNLYKMCDFYMKLVNTNNSPKYDLCWIFLSFNVTADYYVQRQFWM